MIEPDFAGGGGRVHVRTSADYASDYEVIIRRGTFDDLAVDLPDVVQAERYVIIADATVAKLYSDRLRSALERAGLAVGSLSFPAGEAHKTRENWIHLTDSLLRLGIGRDGCIIALGGGVTADLAGFVAATYMRGIPVVQVPTTLLAMIDASVGGKTGVDTSFGKNLVGSFHPPRVVVSDPTVLKSLSDVELRSGLAEAVKHGAIADGDYLDFIEHSADRILARDADPLTRLITRSVEIKGEIVARDPYESGEREVLNFGHTVGHALEAASDYVLPHGFAVAIGMVTESKIGERIGITEPGTAATLSSVLGRVGLPTRPESDSAIDPDTFAESLTRDKKARAGRPRYTLLRRIGQPARGDSGEWAVPVDGGIVREAISEMRPKG